MAFRAASCTLRLNAPKFVSAGSRAGARRYASTGGHGAEHQGSDMPWMIGSAVIFFPTAAYLLTGSGKKKAEHHAHDSHSDKAAHTETPTKDDEGNEVPEEEVKQSMQAGFRTDSPQDAGAGEGSSKGAQPMTDSDGETASAEDVKASMDKAFKSNSPKDAQGTEEAGSKYDSGAPGQDSRSERDAEQKVKKPASEGKDTSDEGASDAEQKTKKSAPGGKDISNQGEARKDAKGKDKNDEGRTADHGRDGDDKGEEKKQE